MNCYLCGTCCIAPDISTLGKAVGDRCTHLGPDNLCRDYENRPAVCREYRPDEICQDLQEMLPDDRVDYYLRLFGL